MPLSVTWVVPKIECLELVQSLEVFQPGIRDFGSVKVERLELVQSLEVFQPSIRDFGLEG